MRGKVENSQSNANVTPPIETFPQCSEGLYKCGLCEYTGHQSNNLKSHKRVHHGEKISKQTECTICTKKVTRMSDHLLSHTSEGKYSCPLCPKMFKTPPSINLHRETHQSFNKLQCKFCTKYYPRYNLEEHIQRKHGKDEMCDMQQSFENC